MGVEGARAPMPHIWRRYTVLRVFVCVSSALMVTPSRSPSTADSPELVRAFETHCRPSS